MNGKLVGNIVLLAATLALPGCLAVNAAFGLLGLVGPPAAQLAGAAYTVTEYTYEYAANDRTPDQVLLAKFDWLLPTDAGQTMEGPAKTFREVALAPPSAPIRPLPEIHLAAIRPEAVGHSPAALAVLPAATPVTETMTTSPSRPMAQPMAQPMARQRPQAKARKPLAAARPVATAPRSGPAHTYVDRPVDPLLVRLGRVESGLRQAEAMLLSDPGNGVRLSLPCPNNNPCEQGINGAWSIRHPLMQFVPAPAARITGHSSAPSQRSLNT